MARLKATFWHRNKYWLSGLVLTLVPLFYYQSMHPQFPAALTSLTLGDFAVTAMPYNAGAPYQHDGQFVKDFLVMFAEGDVSEIRQAYLTIGEKAVALEQSQQGELAILHGSRYGQTAHAIVNGPIQASDKIWLTIEKWNGEVLQGQWDVPDFLVLP